MKSRSAEEPNGGRTKWKREQRAVMSARWRGLCEMLFSAQSLEAPLPFPPPAVPLCLSCSLLLCVGGANTTRSAKPQPSRRLHPFPSCLARSHPLSPHGDESALILAAAPLSPTCPPTVLLLRRLRISSPALAGLPPSAQPTARPLAPPPASGRYCRKHETLPYRHLTPSTHPSSQSRRWICLPAADSQKFRRDSAKLAR